MNCGGCSAYISAPLRMPVTACNWPAYSACWRHAFSMEASIASARENSWVASRERGPFLSQDDVFKQTWLPNIGERQLGGRLFGSVVSIHRRRLALGNNKLQRVLLHRYLPTMGLKPCALKYTYHYLSIGGIIFILSSYCPLFFINFNKLLNPSLLLSLLLGFYLGDFIVFWTLWCVIKARISVIVTVDAHY